MNFLRLRRTPKLAVPKHETDTFFVDADGVFKKMAPDGTVSEVGGGGGSTLVTESGYYSGGQVAAGNRPPWSILDSGTEVLDRTNPIQPLAIKDGLYIISAEVFVQGALEIAPECDLIFDYTDVAATIRGFGVDNATGFSALVSGSYVLTAGQAIRLTVTTDEFATTVELRNALVSRIGPA